MSAINQTNEAERQVLIERTRQLLQRLEHGCTDGCCDMHAPRPGQHTNGGCRCWYRMDDAYLACATIAETVARRHDRRCWETPVPTGPHHPTQS